jgi:hypothetical protein
MCHTWPPTESQRQHDPTESLAVSLFWSFLGLTALGFLFWAVREIAHYPLMKLRSLLLHSKDFEWASFSFQPKEHFLKQTPAKKLSACHQTQLKALMVDFFSKLPQKN